MSYARVVTEEQFLRDIQLQDSVIRRIEIIGEAARRVSEEGKTAQPGLPWEEMISMRNLMIRDYDGIDLQVAVARRSRIFLASSI